MQHVSSPHSHHIPEILRGIVDRVTYHNPENGWSVLRVTPFNNPHQMETVIVHQTKVFAGATMEFRGKVTNHPKYGRQFQAATAIEKKPASTAALEKYLGSGLIKGVGPKTAKKIVTHFKKKTLAVFEGNIQRLTEVPGIAQKKLEMIRTAWSEHRAIREVMIFLQSHGISTLFAVRIYKLYRDQAIAIVSADPYRLANDFYGIGFFSADKVALSLGLSLDSPPRIIAAVKHVLAGSRELGHCYLTASQIEQQVRKLLDMNISEQLPVLLSEMQEQEIVKTRLQDTPLGDQELCYYSKTLYYDEITVARKINTLNRPKPVDRVRVLRWIGLYCEAKQLVLSEEQRQAISGMAAHHLAVLTGGPGCGKTTITRVLVRLLDAMGLKIILAAPTGRAAQRMSDVIGREAVTIHRLLVWKNGQFNKNEESPLDADVVIIDECSMLDIQLAASLLRAVPNECQLLLIGDADQLPSVGAGNVLKDIIASEKVPCYTLTEIFRQARESLIIKYAHQINQGQIPRIESPFKIPAIWQNGSDCLFIDSDEATREQLAFIQKVKKWCPNPEEKLSRTSSAKADPFVFRAEEPVVPYQPELIIPTKFQHVDLEAVLQSQTKTDELISVLKKVHPWSSLHYGLSAIDIVVKLYLEWIPKYCKAPCEIQVLSPMTRGSLGTLNINQILQETANPPVSGKCQLKIGDKILREGDRVIHRRNNYDLGVFNGDIGVIHKIDNQELTCIVRFYPDQREVIYQRDDMNELDLAYAITIHKSQGSEFEAIILPVLSQHFKMLFKNLIYTGLTRAKKLAIFVGTRKSMAMAVRNQDTTFRQTALKLLLQR